jgi:hypothetical protein
MSTDVGPVLTRRRNLTNLDIQAAERFASLPNYIGQGSFSMVTTV